MKVGWLSDDSTYIGGAELTQAEFAATAPKGVGVVEVAPDQLEVVRGCDVVCVFNSVTYPAETTRALTGKRVVRYFNDVAPHGSPDLTRWLVGNATCVFTSPLHFGRFPWLNGTQPDHRLIPPPVDLERFRSRQNAVERRTGAVAVGPWMNPGKSPHLAAEWAQNAGVPIDFYGAGPFAPLGSQPLNYEQVPDTLARYETFVHLPSVLEPFGRTVVEAWAAGCQVVVNRLVGARYWIEEDPDGLDTAARDFWELVANG
jgi:glycosyltransferase involved in cell wall biosynthesis